MATYLTPEEYKQRKYRWVKFILLAITAFVIFAFVYVSVYIRGRTLNMFDWAIIVISIPAILLFDFFLTPTVKKREEDTTQK